MLRVWLHCALVTAVVVAAVILFTGREPPKPPPPLSEQELRTYIEVAPRIQDALGDVAANFEIARHQGQVDAEALGMRTAAQVDDILGRHRLDRGAWDRLSKRVEQAVQDAR